MPYHYDTINDFRPSLNIAKEHVLYLLPEYKEAIYMFLKPDKDENIYIFDPHYGNERSAFIRPYISVLNGHWGGWHIETHPYINIIIFNKSLNKAKIYFRVGYQGGEATLEKNNSVWIISESKETWIE